MTLCLSRPAFLLLAGMASTAASPPHLSRPSESGHLLGDHQCNEDRVHSGSQQGYRMELSELLAALGLPSPGLTVPMGQVASGTWFWPACATPRSARVPRASHARPLQLAQPRAQLTCRPSFQLLLLSSSVPWTSPAAADSRSSAAGCVRAEHQAQSYWLRGVVWRGFGVTKGAQARCLLLRRLRAWRDSTPATRTKEPPPRTLLRCSVRRRSTALCHARTICFLAWPVDVSRNA